MKMETPKMDVVRFKEADVLAASPVPVDNNYYAFNSGWGGATGGASLRIVQNENVIANYDWNAISSGEAAHLINNNINFNGLSLGTMYEDECSDNPQYDEYNGEWISSNGVDYRRRQ